MSTGTFHQVFPLTRDRCNCQSNRIKTAKGGETLEATAEADERAIAIQNLQGVIRMGRGPDWVEGFGDATLDGGQGFDTLSFGSYHKSDFQISFGSNKGEARFELDGLTMQTSGFENYLFADGNYSDDWLMA